MLYGDSLMAGYGLTQNENLSSILKNKIKKNYMDLDLINASVSGNTSKDGLARLKWSLEDKPTVLILCLGANDMLRGIDPKITKKNLNEIIIQVKQKNIIIILSGMLAPDSMGQDYKRQFDDIYPKLAKEHQLIFMPFFLQDIALQEEYLLNDYMHPNHKGIKIIADNLFPYIKKSINILTN
jgi:acyl-CoA thioesterase-1|tara:strand:- start:75 stop:620 length:546 start_codon:yes stop_codon:yes gene_type:complete